MKISKSINDLCEKNTYLKRNEINKIIEISRTIGVMADFYDGDVFIDVLSMDKNKAIVVFHAKPTTVKSMYVEDITGEEALRVNEPGVLKTLETGVPCKDIKAVTQENIIVKQKIQPILIHNKVIGVIIAEKDISEEVKEEFRIKDSNKELVYLMKNNNILTDSLDDAVLIFDNTGTLIINNNNAINVYKKLGYMEDIKNMSYDNLSLDKVKYKDLVEDLKEKKKIIQEINFADYYFKVTRTFLDNDGEFEVLSIIKDITYIKKKEKEMELKEVEIREAHHRIKNNLQTTAALLRRQSRDCVYDESKETLDESVSRILTIATTHDLLSKSKFNKLSIRDSISAIVDNINSIEYNSKVRTLIYGEDFEIYGEKATALLLAINEIIQNSYKHAFKGRVDGNIKIKISREEKNITIDILDDGVGFSIENTKKDGLGMGIINSYITEVLRGQIKLSSGEEGTKTTIKFLNK
ncbi:MAG: sensor histidine kinase [Clostridium sp.]|uniref:sensor histidine kinase n=1 Tax=Clostridium sp. TaxID=1506 RepID=UPI003F392ADE